MQPLQAVNDVVAEPEAVRPDVTVATGTEPDALVLDELLVEDVSIDGMCGVY